MSSCNVVQVATLDDQSRWQPVIVKADSRPQVLQRQATQHSVHIMFLIYMLTIWSAFCYTAWIFRHNQRGDEQTATKSDYGDKRWNRCVKFCFHQTFI